MGEKTLFIVLGIVVFLIADAFYVYYVLKKYWKKSRYNPANRRPDKEKSRFHIGLKQRFRQ